MAVKKGYKQTEVGVIPEDWEVATLQDLTVASQPITYGVLKPGAYVPYGVPLLQIQDVIYGNIDVDSLHRIGGALDSQYLRTRLSEDDIVISLVGTVGKVALIPRKLAGANLHRNLAKVRVSSKSSKGFVLFCLRAESAQKAIGLSTFGTTQALLNLADLRNLKLPAPQLAEQEAIAGALSDADAWIESLEQLIAKKRQTKQGAMQELLTGKRRLAGFSGEWVAKRLGDLGSTYGGLAGKTKSDFGAGDAFYVTFMNVMSNVVIDCTTFERVNVVASESQNRVLKNDILFNGSSETPEEVAMCAFVDTEVKDVYLNSFCFGFRLRDDSAVDGRFLAYYLRSNVGREMMKSLAQGSTRYNLSKTALLKAVLQLPCATEQTAIATLLSDMDTEIESLKSKLAKVRRIKQGMMQELLTGRIRLV